MTTFLFIVLLLLSAFLVMIVLLQRGRGAGLAGAFGAGGGANSAFGTKVGDVFTTVTVVAFVLFMVLSIVLFNRLKWTSQPDQIPGRDAVTLGTNPYDAVDISDTSLTLVWKDQASNAIGYHISRTTGDGKYANLPDVKANSPDGHYSIKDSGLTPGTDYYYRVEAFNNSPIGSASPSYEAQQANNGTALHAKTTGKKPDIVPETGPSLEALIKAAQSATASAPATASATASAPATAPTPATTKPAASAPVAPINTTTSAPATTTKP